MDNLAALPVPSAQIMAQLADALAWPLLLVRPDGSLLHANLAGRQALGSQSALQLAAERRVRAARPEHQADLEQALASAAAGQRRLLHWPGPPACTAIFTALPTAANTREPCVLLLALGMAWGIEADGSDLPHAMASPDAAGAPIATFDGHAGNGVSPGRGAHASGADTAAFAAAHGLTPAEARVLQRLALGESPARVAAALRVEVATVRSQAAAVRRKTGHSSTAALVSAAALGSPIWHLQPGLGSARPPSAGAT